MMRAILIMLISVFYLSASCSGVSAETSNRIVALVQSEVITLHELHNRIEEVTGQRPYELKARDKENYRDMAENILDIMIDEILARKAINELNIQVTNRDVDYTVESIKASNNWTHEEMLEYLNQEGLSYGGLRERIREDLERRNLIEREVQSRIVISKQDVVRYYKEHQDKYRKSGEVEIASIFLMRRNPADSYEMERLTEKGKEILERLNSGELFEDLARRFSEGPGAEDGGYLGTFKLSQLDAGLADAIKNLKEGEVSNLLVRDSSLQIVKLLNRKDADLVPLEEVEDDIYENLYAEEINRRYTAWFNELRSRSYIKKLF